MTTTGEVAYSLDGKPVNTITSQSHGLKDLGDQVVRVFIPLPSSPSLLRLNATSEGIKAIYPTSVNKTGKVTSETLELPFPKPGESISFVSFSDLHEQSKIYEELSAQIPWEEMDLAVYDGDLLNSTIGPDQVTRAILGLPTGNRELPRIFVRGNHETRNESARLLDDWLLPENGHWYQAFTLGNTFFIVLDSGEDKPDNDKEYSGLVDFSAYHLQQAQWLEAVLASQEFKAAQYQVVLLHIPLFGEDKVPPSFEPVAALLRSNKEIDLMVNGHTHEYGIFTPEDSVLPYPAAFSGGPETDTAAAVLVNMDKDGFRVRIMSIDGKIVDQIP
jgi:acid phosphatase type 7